MTASIKNYDVGDVARLRVSFVNSGGVSVDPSSLTVQYRHTEYAPSSLVAITYTGANSLAKAGAGEYYLDLPINSETLAHLVNSGSPLAGRWEYRWNGTGDNAAAVERSFNVNHRVVG